MTFLKTLLRPIDTKQPMRAQFVNSENKTESHISFSISTQILHTLGVAEHHLDMRLCDACQGINISFGLNAATAKNKWFVCRFLHKIQERKKSSIKSTAAALSRFLQHGFPIAQIRHEFFTIYSEELKINNHINRGNSQACRSYTSSMNWKSETLVLGQEGKTEREKPLEATTSTNNKLNPHEIESGHCRRSHEFECSSLALQTLR